ncbi:GntR family transcriptional regulator [Hwanghaeella sp.]|uniref:GntR family transcriptional regulator n=1 Tax=Hwanghaeella sp. TaxID=2605943 RepID=UPI003CCC1392
MSGNDSAERSRVRDPLGSGGQVMPLPVDALGGKSASAALRSPLYHQIYLILRDKILSAEYPHGTVLPGEFDLADYYGVSRITVKRALDELASDGLVMRERGRGTTVTHEGKGPAISAAVEGQLEDLLSMGYETQVRLLDFAYVPAPPEAAAALHLDLGAQVQRAVRTRSKDGVPFSHLTTYVPADLGRSFGPDDMLGKPLLALLEDAGVRVASASQTITATLADHNVAAALDLDVGSALLKVSRTVFDSERRPVEFITALYRPDSYCYQMSLSRVSAAGANSWSPKSTGYKLA